MAAASETSSELHDTDGFLVESPEGEIGWVEEIWLGEANEPRALVVQTRDGRHALLLEEDVVAVEREQRWVVVPRRPTLLELAPPRLTNGDSTGPGVRMTASWATTGAPLAALAQPSWRWRLHLPHPRPAAAARKREPAERPLWLAIAVLYASLALVIASLITLAFLIARLVSGAAY